MQYIQVINAPDIMDARRQYLDTLHNGGLALMPSTEIYVEAIHTAQPDRHDQWLCYLALPRDRAA